MRDFMSFTFTKKVKVSLQKKSDIYEVTAVDNELLSYNNRMIDHKIKEIKL